VLSVHEDDYKENVFVKATYKGDRDAKTFQGNLKIEDTHEEENVFIEATYRENVSINATYKEDRHAETFQVDLKIEDTYEVDVLNLTFMKKDVQLMIDDADIEGRDAKTSQGNLMIEDTYEYPTHEADYKEDVFVKDDQQYMMHTQQGTAHREDKDAKTLHGHTVIKNTYKKDVLARQVVTDNAYQGNMLTVSPQENVVLMNAYKKYVQSAVDKITVKEDVDDEHYNLNNKNLIDNGQDDIKMNNLMYKRGAEEDARKLAVSAIASRRGEKGA
jgi:hypothetical protein